MRFNSFIIFDFDFINITLTVLTYCSYHLHSSLHIIPDAFSLDYCCKISSHHTLPVAIRPLGRWVEVHYELYHRPVVVSLKQTFLSNAACCCGVEAPLIFYLLKMHCPRWDPIPGHLAL